MTTQGETLMLISRLNINEEPPDQSLPSGIWRGTPQSTTQLKSVNKETGDCSGCIVAPTVQDINTLDEEVTRVIGSGEASRIGKDREMAVDDLENEPCRHCTEIDKTIEPRKTDHIHINYNYGTVIVDLGEGYVEGSTTGVGIETKTSRSCDIPSSRRLSHFPGKSSFGGKIAGFKSSRNARQNQLKRKKIKRRQRQSLINFPQCKKTNVKSISGFVSHSTKNDNADNRMVNIHVINNSGKIVIGDNVSYYEGSPGLESRCQSNEDGGTIVTDGSEIVSPQRGPVFCVDKNTMKWVDKFYRITNEIYPLRDNGRWEDFYEKVNKGIWFARQNRLQEEEILLTIEKSIALGYQKKNDESKQTVKLANDLILSRPGLNMREFLVALSHCQLAALQRRASKLTKASKSVFIAEQNVEFVPSYLAKAYVIYEKASNWYWQCYYCHELGQGSLRDNFANEAKKEFKKCISTCEQVLAENDTLYLRRHHFSLVKLALMNLNCSTTATRNEPVSEDDVREAGDCISRMHQRYSGQMGESTSMLLHCAQTDQFFRQGDYTNAEISARQALHKAESSGFQLQIHELRERLEDITLLKQQRPL